MVKVYRCATVVKGGRRFSFAALVVGGDRKGEVGIGYGKANEVPSAVEKAVKSARRNMIKIKLDGTPLPHQVMSKYRASKVSWREIILDLKRRGLEEGPKLAIGDGALGF